MVQPQVVSMTDNRAVALPADRILPSPYQTRRVFDPAALQQLAESIAQHGLLQPITVRRTENGFYQLIAGERRWRACRLIGMRHIRAYVLQVEDYEAALLTMSENLQREDLNFFEEALGYQLLMQLQGVTQQQLADHLGVSQAAVANKLRLLRFSEPVRAAILTKGLTERHARALLKLFDDQDRLEAIEFISQRRLSVRQTEEWVEKRQQAQLQNGGDAHRRPSITHSWRDWRLFANSMKSAVGELRQAGLPARFEMSESGTQVQMSIIVPKG
ncbi:MAG: ParB/RepB/Spo0J family partition protein [Eubacteriales bacterium]|nr:ParB/RepB/Spo0J family partition protein [Eubacteriales bacterium]